MDYLEVSFEGLTAESKEQLMGFLVAWNHNGMEEDEASLKVYFGDKDFDLPGMEALAEKFGCNLHVQNMPEQNWNSTWEKNFQPVILGDFCGIRADFHAQIKGVKHELIITPKMSFGTGHHATTALMVQFISGLDLRKKQLLDFGCGTGILSILAEKVGADTVLALDNDDWSIQNAIENLSANDCHRIEVKNELISNLSCHFDCIFANINRNVLLASMETFPDLLNDKGLLLMSGFFAGHDEEVVQSAAEAAGLHWKNRHQEGKWAALLFQKSL